MDVEDLLAERGIVVSYESIGHWCNRFGPEYAHKLKKRQGRLGDTRYLDEVFIKIRGELHCLWRALDQDGDTIDILVQKRRNKAAAKRFFRKLLKGQNEVPWRMITDKLKSYAAAHREVMPSVAHSTEQYENNRAEMSHEPTRQRERQMRRFKFSLIHSRSDSRYRKPLHQNCQRISVRQCNQWQHQRRSAGESRWERAFH